MMNTRLKKLVEDFSRHKNIDALLIVNDSNIRYLTQFPASESWLLVTKIKGFLYYRFPVYSGSPPGTKRRYCQTI